MSVRHADCGVRQLPFLQKMTISPDSFLCHSSTEHPLKSPVPLLSSLSLPAARTRGRRQNTWQRTCFLPRITSHQPGLRLGFPSLLLHVPTEYEKSLTPSLFETSLRFPLLPTTFTCPASSQDETRPGCRISTVHLGPPLTPSARSRLRRYPTDNARSSHRRPSP